MWVLARVCCVADGVKHDRIADGQNSIRGVDIEIKGIGGQAPASGQTTGEGAKDTGRTNRMRERETEKARVTCGGCTALGSARPPNMPP